MILIFVVLAVIGVIGSLTRGDTVSGTLILPKVLVLLLSCLTSFFSLKPIKLLHLGAGDANLLLALTYCILTRSRCELKASFP